MLLFHCFPLSLLLFLGSSILLQGILFLLTFPAFGALGGGSLVPKGRPGTIVFAALAPLDFQATVRHDPDGNVTGSAESLVLSRNNVVGFRRCFVLVSTTNRHAALAGQAGSRAVPLLTTHDAVLLAIRVAFGRFAIGTTGFGQVIGVVDQSVKLGKLDVLGGIGWTPKLGWKWFLQWNTSLGIWWSSVGHGSSLPFGYGRNGSLLADAAALTRTG